MKENNNKIGKKYEDIYYVSSERQHEPFYINIAGVTYPDGGYRINRIKSPVCVVEYVIDGKGTIFLDGKEYLASGGDVYILRRGHDHLYYSDKDDPWHKMWMNCAGSLIDSLLRVYGLDGEAVIHGPEAAGYFERILELCRGGVPADEVNRKAALIFHELILYLYGQRSKVDYEVSPEAAAVKVYIDAHFTEDIMSDKLAGMIFRSPSQMIRIFRKNFGVTPYEYMLGQRFDLAKVLLLNTNMMIKEIAFRTGFSDEHYFSYLFRRKCGMTPKEYRSAGHAEKVKKSKEK